LFPFFSGHTGTATGQQDLPSGIGRLSPTGFMGKFVLKKAYSPSHPLCHYQLDLPGYVKNAQA
jgi:hypothetical protein